MSTHDHNSQDNTRDFQAENATPSQLQATGSNAMTPPPFSVAASNPAQFKGEEEEEMQMKEAGKGETFQLKGDAEAPDGGGDVMSKMEGAFGTSFSDVNFHTESNKASEVGALAYTQGSDIHFAPGQFKPDTKSGQELIGHELTHVVQQREGRVKPTTEVAGMPVNDDKGLEKEADDMGAKAAQAKFVGRSGSTGKASGNATQMKADVAQFNDVHGRVRFHDTGNSTPFGNADYNQDNHLSFMMRWSVPNWNIEQWQTALASGGSNFSENLAGFLVFAMRPELAGCDAATMAAFIEPLLNSSSRNLGGQRLHDAELETELEQRGLAGSLIVHVAGGDVSTEPIENYWNRATAPTDRQKEDFVIAMMTNSDDMSLPEASILDGLSRLGTYMSLFRRNIAEPALRHLVNHHYGHALTRIASDPELRSVAPQGVEFMAEYGDNRMRSKMMAKSGSTAMAGLAAYAGNLGNEQSKNNALNLIRQSGTTMQAILQAQSNADARAHGMVDVVFDTMWSLVPGAGILDTLKDRLKDELKNALHDMVNGDNMTEKIQNFRRSFNTSATNMVGDVPDMTAEQASIAVNTLFSSSGGI